jgi:dipeptidyl aminopeptidase/acylaminoacyl peptidase
MRWGILSALAALMICAQPAGAQGGRIAFSLDDEIWTMRADGSERTRLTDTPGEATSRQPDWSPDGKQVAFARGAEEESIWVRDFATGSEHRITRPKGAVIDGDPDWSPDGGTIVFARHRFGRNRISTAVVAIDLATGRERTLARTSSRRSLVFYGSPALSPDGTRLLYTLTKLDRTAHFAPTMYVLDVTTGKSTKVAARGGDGEWSPDGRRIAFTSIRDRNGESCGSDECSWQGELYLANADGTGLTRLTENKGHDGQPAWVPDGGAIVFASNRNSPEGGSELYAIRPDGSCLTWLTNGAQESYAPDWQPGSGGLPEPFACGAVPREPTLLETPKGNRLWLGPVAPGNMLLTNAGEDDLTYGDCSKFEPSECGKSVDLQTGTVCRFPPLAELDAIRGSFEPFRGALVERGRQFAVVYSGDVSVNVYKPRPEVLDALRPLPSADPVQSLEPPRFPAKLIARVKRARKLGSVRRVAHGLHMSAARARRLLAFAEAIERFEPIKPANC